MNTPAFEQPTFIVGAPRSGTAFLFRVITGHKNVCTIMVPNAHIGRFIIEEMFSIAPTSSYFLNKYFNIPLRSAEGTSVWRNRIFDKSDVLIETNSQLLRNYTIKHVIKKNIELSGKKYFIAKDPTLSFKIKYLNEIFPNAKFVHIYRDGRAVVNSSIKMWENKSKYQKWWGAKPENWKKILKTNNLTDICAHQWAETIEQIEKDQKILQKNRFYEIQYVDLVNNFHDEIKNIIKFIGLEMNSKFLDFLKTKKAKNMNWKWKDTLTKEQIEILENNKKFIKMMEKKKLI